MQNAKALISIESRNIKLTDANTEYITKKFSFLDKFDKYITKIQILIIDNKSQTEKLAIDISITTKKELIRIEEKGFDLYSLIDTAHDSVKLKMEKYKDKVSTDIKSHERFSQAEDKLSSSPEANPDITPSDGYVYSVQQFYKPKITKRITYSDNRPMHPSEAIEQMEVLGHSSFLFKNIETNKYSMINKLNEGKYALIEPETV